MARAADLSSNIVDFCAVLRGDLHFHVGHAEAREALRAAELVGIADGERVRAALRLVLCSKPEELDLFDAAFDAFFLHPRRGARQGGYAPRHSRAPSPPSAKAGPRGADQTETERDSSAEADEDGAFGAHATHMRAVEEEPGDPAAAWQQMRAQYSPQPGTADPPLVARASVEATMRAASDLVASVRLGRLRRWKPQPRGRRFDMRRTLRASLQTGGDPMTLRRLGHPLRNPRFVVLLDGSRSMASHGDLMLSFAYALCRRTLRANAFVFSTQLREVTLELRAAARLREHRLASAGEAWGGGTRIGSSLAEFVARHGGRRLTPETVTIIYSDGLDVGDIRQLERAMREIHRRSAAVVWVNPLAGTSGYAPTARGMKAALPYIDAFVGARDAGGLADLVRQTASATR